MRAVNLLPTEYRSASRRGGPSSPAAGGWGPFIVLGALALCVIAMAAYVMAANTVEERRAELARVTAEHEVASSRAQALKPYADFQSMAVVRRETVASLATLRFDWERALRDVSHALPTGVTLSSLDGSISEKTGAGSQLRAAIPSPAITLKGCARNQAGVATLLSRLRGVRGVTRVSLSKSEQVESSGATGATPGPCGEGAHPQFEVVVFFERSVAATAPGGAAPATAPAPAAGPSPAPAPSQPPADAGTGSTGASPTPSATPTP